jgi:diacylglycerol kinase family enzyme
MRRLLLVANPAASGFTATQHRFATETLSGSFALTAVWPNDAAEAEETAREGASHFDVVVAMGGDGVVHRVANGIVGSTAALAVIPVGTTNVFARIIGMPRKAGAAAEAIATARAGLLPTLRVDSAGGRTAIFAAGVGFDAAVIRQSDKRPLGKVGTGTLHYVRSGVRVAFTEYRRPESRLEITVDGEAMQGVSALVQIHDTLSYVGRRALSLSPQGGPAVLALSRAGPLRLLRALVRSALGARVERIRGARLWSPFQTLSITAEPAIPCEIDGEYFGEVAEFRATVRPDSIRVMIPQA